MDDANGGSRILETCLKAFEGVKQQRVINDRLKHGEFTRKPSNRLTCRLQTGSVKSVKINGLKEVAYVSQEQYQ